MGESQLDRLFASLDASFEAARARAEDEAAADLAISLRADVPLADALPRAGSVAMKLPGSEAIPVTLVGRDFVAASGGDVLCPLAKALLILRPEGPLAVARDERLIEILRRWRREEAPVSISAAGHDVEGTLIGVGRDHLVLAASGGRVVIPLEAVDVVRRGRGGSTDAR